MTCGKKFSYFPSNHTGKYCSKQCCYKSSEWKIKQRLAKIGRRHSLKTRLKMSLAKKGRMFSNEHKKNLSLSQKGTQRLTIRGKNHWNWKDGKTEKLRGTRRGRKFRVWRTGVLLRDNYACIFCGSKKNICVDHIVPFASILYEANILKTDGALYSINNGRTLCKKCHLATPTYNSKLENQTEYKYMFLLEKLWKQTKSNDIEFETFYRQQTERFIDIIKEKLHE